MRASRLLLNAASRVIYLDTQSTTFMDPRVLDKMMPFYTKFHGNPHSRTHIYGWESEVAVEEARSQIASAIGCMSKEIIFTSGATESNNLAIKGVAGMYGKTKRHLVTSQIEHKCVLQCMRALESQGYRVTYLKPNFEGIITLEQVEKSITDETFLVSIMHVNNEIGVVQDIEGIGKICRSKGVLFHSDCAQSFCKIPLKAQNIDLISLSGHKIYGPMGVGALYVRTKPRIRLAPLIDGGGQERNMRSGTLAPALAVGFGEAARIGMEEMDYDYQNVRKMYNYLLSQLECVPHVSVNGPKSDPQRYPGNLNISFAYVEGESLLMSIDGFAVSSGSACTSSSLEPSYVLRSLGVSEELAHTSIRFGFGRFTRLEHLQKLVPNLVSAVERLRTLSPLYEFATEGGTGPADAHMRWT